MADFVTQQSPQVTLVLLRDAACQAATIKREIASIKATALDDGFQARKRTTSQDPPVSSPIPTNQRSPVPTNQRSPYEKHNESQQTSIGGGVYKYTIKKGLEPGSPPETVQKPSDNLPLYEVVHGEKRAPPKQDDEPEYYRSEESQQYSNCRKPSGIDTYRPAHAQAMQIATQFQRSINPAELHQQLLARLQQANAAEHQIHNKIKSQKHTASCQQFRWNASTTTSAALQQAERVGRQKLRTWVSMPTSQYTPVQSRVAAEEAAHASSPPRSQRAGFRSFSLPTSRNLTPSKGAGQKWFPDAENYRETHFSLPSVLAKKEALTRDNWSPLKSGHTPVTVRISPRISGEQSNVVYGVPGSFGRMSGPVAASAAAQQASVAPESAAGRHAATRQPLRSMQDDNRQDSMASKTDSVVAAATPRKDVIKTQTSLRQLLSAHAALQHAAGGEPQGTQAVAVSEHSDSLEPAVQEMAEGGMETGSSTWQPIASQPGPHISAADQPGPTAGQDTSPIVGNISRRAEATSSASPSGIGPVETQSVHTDEISSPRGSEQFASCGSSPQGSAPQEAASTREGAGKRSPEKKGPPHSGSSQGNQLKTLPPSPRQQHRITPTASLKDARQAEHAIGPGSALLREFPTVGKLTGRALLQTLATGTLMHKSWERSTGKGSQRMIQCFVGSNGAVVLQYVHHGLVRQLSKYTVTSVHVPAGPWLPSKYLTVDTVAKGTIYLQPYSGLDYTTWVFGLNAAFTAAKGTSVGAVEARAMEWNKALFVLY